jgi:hypothetical protein
MKPHFTLKFLFVALLALFANRSFSEQANPIANIQQPKPADGQPPSKASAAKPVLCCGKSVTAEATSTTEKPRHNDGAPMRSILISTTAQDRVPPKDEKEGEIDPKTGKPVTKPAIRTEKAPPKGEREVEIDPKTGKPVITPANPPTLIPRPPTLIPRPERPMPRPEKPVVDPETPLIKPDLTAKPLLGCKHEITLQNLNSASQVTQVRISPYSGGASIQAAYGPTGWSMNSSAAGFVFKKGGAVIPVGTYPGFVITMNSNNQGQQWVLVEWLTAQGQVICGQPLYVP